MLPSLPPSSRIFLQLFNSHESCASIFWAVWVGQILALIYLPGETYLQAKLQLMLCRS